MDDIVKIYASAICAGAFLFVLTADPKSIPDNILPKEKSHPFLQAGFFSQLIPNYKLGYLLLYFFSYSSVSGAASFSTSSPSSSSCASLTRCGA